MDKIKLNRGCNRCGYKSNPDALTFYTPNPILKLDLEPNESDGKKYNLQDMMNEVDKTEILCLNCEKEETSLYRAE